MKYYKLVLIFLFFLSESILAQDSSVDSINFKPLKEYVGKAHSSLIKHLDSVFSNTKKVDYKLGSRQYEVNKYLERSNDGIKYRKNQYPYFLSFYSFKRENNYKISRDYLEDYNNFGRPRLDTTENKFVLFHKNDNAHYWLRNFYVPHIVYWDYNNMSVENSILVEGMSAKSYDKCIVENLFYWNRYYIDSYANELKQNNPKRYQLLIENKDSLYYWYNEFSRIKFNYLEIKDSYVNSFKLYSYTDSTHVSISNSRVDSINISNHKKLSFSFRDETAWGKNRIPYRGKYNGKILNSENNDFDYFDFDVSFEKVEIVNCTNIRDFSFPKMHDTLILNDITGSKILIHQDIRSREEKSKIFLWNIDYDKLKTQWTGYELFRPDSIWTNDHLNSVYLSLISHFKIKGYEESFIEIDSQYQQWKYLNDNKVFLDWIDRNWWYYGHKKLLIVKNTFLLFLFFSVINCFFINQMSKNLYQNFNIAKQTKKYKRKKFLKNYIKNFVPTIFYTSQIFFGVRFQYDKLKYENKLKGIGVFGLIYFFVIYISGLVCVGYLINVIITI